jgi:tetratricopeptide (TPR) repeat protein
MRARLALAAAAVLALAGCRAKEISKEQREQAHLDASDAEFAVTIHDLARAEGMFAKAAELCPDEGDTWLKLGIVRMQLKNPDGARQAYKSAGDAFKDAHKANPSDSSARPQAGVHPRAPRTQPTRRGAWWRMPPPRRRMTAACRDSSR